MPLAFRADVLGGRDNPEKYQCAHSRVSGSECDDDFSFIDGTGYYAVSIVVTITALVAGLAFADKELPLRR